MSSHNPQNNWSAFSLHTHTLPSAAAQDRTLSDARGTVNHSVGVRGTGSRSGPLGRCDSTPRPPHQSWGRSWSSRAHTSSLQALVGTCPPQWSTRVAQHVSNTEKQLLGNKTARETAKSLKNCPKNRRQARCCSEARLFHCCKLWCASELQQRSPLTSHNTERKGWLAHSQTLQSTPSNSSSDLLIFIVTHHMETSQPISQFDVSSLLLYFLMYMHMLWNIFQGLEINPRTGQEPDLSCFPQCNFLQQLVQSYTKNTGRCPYGSIEFNFSVLKTTAFQLHKMCK